MIFCEKRADFPTLNDSKNKAENPFLPEELVGLSFLSSNFYFTWDRRIGEIFSTLDPKLWEETGRNPQALLDRISTERIEELKSDRRFLSRLDEAVEIQRSYLSPSLNRWFNLTFPYRGDGLVAYFSMEFGIGSFLKIYSGGLGILSGDHLKSASDLGVPMVGIGLFYSRGYFSQSLNSEGWQLENYPPNRPVDLPIELVSDEETGGTLVFAVPLANRDVMVRVWRANVGRTPLYLLDTNLAGQNSAEDCQITSELYGGDSDTRIKQEIVLGFGGARLIRILGLRPTVFHMNEGHSSFASLERISQIIEGSYGRKSFPAALVEVKNATVFTTHTPVPAGIDIFTSGQIQHYLSKVPSRIGISMEDLFSLGQETPNSLGFNMAVFAIRTSSMVNGVSNLHRHVARKLWEKVLQEETLDLSTKSEEPASKVGKRMKSVTNGVHVPSWISTPMADLLDEYLGREWPSDNWKPEIWRPIEKIPAERLWEVRQKSRTALLKFVKSRLAISDFKFGEDVLTLGFARRFATYKRATLLFSDHVRLERILNANEKPIQFIFAGKAHPKDHDGKKMIQEISLFLKSKTSGGRVLFIPDYDIDVARNMVQGVDVWLNNPRRPLEASGTSGMKVLCNAGINLSVLDGWWDEAYTPSNGWAIGTGASTEASNPLQDRQDAESLYDLLENSVIPEFYARTDGLPLKWIERMKRSMSGLTPRFSSSRMVIEYAKNFYFENRRLEEGSRNPNESDLLTDS